MIISHKYKFIFIKTLKTAGTSIETYLSQVCGDDDIVTPIFPHVKPHVARNYTGYFNPIPAVVSNAGRGWRLQLRALCARQKFYNHIPARLVKSRVPAHVWSSYFKFCVERNPWDKTLSHYFMQKHRASNPLSLDDYFNRANFCLNHPLYTDERNRILVDQVVKYEELDPSLDAIFSDLNIPFPGALPVKAKSEYRDSHAPYCDVLSADQCAIVARAFATEIAMHGYRFEWQGPNSGALKDARFTPLPSHGVVAA